MHVLSLVPKNAIVKPCVYVPFQFYFLGCRTIKFELSFQQRLYLLTLSSITVIDAHCKEVSSENGGGGGKLTPA